MGQAHTIGGRLGDLAEEKKKEEVEEPKKKEARKQSMWAGHHHGDIEYESTRDYRCPPINAPTHSSSRALRRQSTAETSQSSLKNLETRNCHVCLILFLTDVS